MKDINLLSLLAVFIFNCIGAWEHFRFARKQGRITGNFWTYLVSAAPGNSMFTYVMIGASSWALVESGIGDNVNPELMLMLLIKNHSLPFATFAAIGVCLLTGYSLDSRFNKGGEPAKIEEMK